jgi:hypothetical protein
MAGLFFLLLNSLYQSLPNVEEALASEGMRVRRFWLLLLEAFSVKGKPWTVEKR